MITSAKNPKIQWVRSLQGRARERREAGAFPVEGVRLAEEALAAGWEAQWVAYTPDLGPRGLAVVDSYRAQGVPVELASPEVLRQASDTETPQGILVVLTARPLPLPQDLDFAFIVDGVRDPGNLGTMLRTAAAAGVGAVFLPPGNVDPFAPKVVRAGMGAHFRVPLLVWDWEQIAAAAGQSSLRLFFAAAGEGLPYNLADFRQPTALVIGGEAEGVGSEGRRVAQQPVHIPMPGGSESLNAAVAAAVLLFEVVRQRSAGPGSTG